LYTQKISLVGFFGRTVVLRKLSPTTDTRAGTRNGLSSIYSPLFKNIVVPGVAMLSAFFSVKKAWPNVFPLLLSSPFFATYSTLGTSIAPISTIFWIAAKPSGCLISCFVNSLPSAVLSANSPRSMLSSDGTLPGISLRLNLIFVLIYFPLTWKSYFIFTKNAENTVSTPHNQLLYPLTYRLWCSPLH